MLVMLLVSAFAPFVVLVTAVAADPKAIRDSPLSLSFTKHWHTNDDGTFHPIKSDRKRFKNLMKGGQKCSSSNLETTQANSEAAPEVALNNTGVAYLAKVGVGNPPTYCEACQCLPGIVSYMSTLDKLIVDTGSANTWVGGNLPYKKTNTSVQTLDRVVSIVSCLDCWTSSNQNLWIRA
jgi:hypothetical protein